MNTILSMTLRVHIASSLAALVTSAATFVFVSTCLSLAHAQSSTPDTGAPIVIDSVAASVNGKPITLQDISDRLGVPGVLSIKEASTDTRARDALESLIMERLVVEEASSRNITVSEVEIDRYIEEVSRRNNMSRDEFENALALRQTKLSDYRSQVSSEIMRTRLMGQISQEGAAVTQADIDGYLSENPSLKKSGSKVRLRQVVVSFKGRDQEAAEARAKEARQKIEDGASFQDVAAEYSDGPEASDGGLLGVVAEEDLSPAIFETLLALDVGTPSAVVALPDSFRVFQVDERFMAKDDDDEANELLIADIRRKLSERKMQERMQSFFTSDIRKLHFIDRKL